MRYLLPLLLLSPGCFILSGFFFGGFCGDGLPEDGEECDDGNSFDGDGCDADCTSSEIPLTCGDGNLDIEEQCDDGNNINGDGCDADCTLSGASSCGDGVVDEGELCLLATQEFLLPNARDIAAADFNDDGRVDLVVGAELGELHILLSDPRGFLLRESIIPAPFGLVRVKVDDFNEDGLFDLFLIHSGGVDLMQGNGDASFSFRETFFVSQAKDAQIADFDGDGTRDIVVTSPVGVTLIFANGAPSFQLATGIDPQELVLADFNEDAILDIATANSASGIVSVLIGESGGAFFLRTDIAVGINPIGLAAGDINGDSIVDLVVANSAQSNGGVGIIVGDGTGNFSLDPINLPPMFDVALVDVDQDQDLDIIASETNGGNINVLRMDNEALVEQQVIAVGGQVTSVLAADLNGDGRVDIAGANRAQGEAFVIPNRGDSFQANVHATGQSPRGMVFADLNGAGNDELIVANNLTNNMTLFPDFDGSGSFAQTFATSGAPEGITSGDFDGDGFNDVAITNVDAGTVDIFRGDGVGLSTEISFGNFVAPLNIKALDINQDSIVDLVLTDFGGAQVNVIFGNGDGSFGVSASLLTEELPAFFVVGDFNNDSLIDLAVTHPSENRLTLFFGDGFFFGESQQSPLELASGAGVLGAAPIGVATGDFDQDERLDLVVACRDTNNVVLFFGGEGGVFADPLALNIGVAPFEVLVVDINNDGAVDIITTNQNNDNISILLGDDVGNFEGPLFFAAGDGARSMLASDINNDDAQDLLITNEFANNLSVLLSNP